MNEIDEIKARIDIATYIGRFVTLKKAGRNFKGLCPFHNEKSPSFMVSPDRATFHCFGCAAGGSVIDFLMKYRHLDFPEALEELAHEAGVTLTRRAGSSPEDKLKDRLFEANEKAAEYFHYLLTKHSVGEKALLYLRNRGITDRSIETFTLGYSANSWDGLLSFLKKKGFDDTTIERAGLAIKGSRGLYDRFRGRVMFTLKDHKGRAVGFAGRVLDPDAKEAKYINTNETPIYVKSNILYGLDVTKDSIAKSGSAIVMEGELDMISSFQAGVGNAVAIKGSALTEGHIHLLKRFAETIIFSLDADMAGDAAARRGIELADQAGMDMKVVTIPAGKDPDEAARQDPVGFKKAIAAATPIYDYFISSSTKRFDLATAFGKKKASDELLPMLTRISNTIVQAHYRKIVAQTLDVSEETVSSGMKKVKQPIDAVRVHSAESDLTIPKRTGREASELYVLALVVNKNTYALLQKIRTVGVVFRDAGISRLISLFTEVIQTDAPVDWQKVTTQIPSELLPLFDEAYLMDMSDVIEDPERFSEDADRAIREIRRHEIRDQIKKCTDKMKSDTLSEEEAAAVQADMSRLTRDLRTLEK